MIWTETKRYKVTSDRFGNFTIRRHKDGASVYLQGDDAITVRENLDALERQNKRGFSPANSYEATFDWLCSQYDSVMETDA